MPPLTDSFTDDLLSAARSAGLGPGSTAELLRLAIGPTSCGCHPGCTALPTADEWFDYIDTHCNQAEKAAITDIVNAYIIREEDPEGSISMAREATDRLERERTTRALLQPDSIGGGGDGGKSERERRIDRRLDRMSSTLPGSAAPEPSGRRYKHGVPPHVLVYRSDLDGFYAPDVVPITHPDGASQDSLEVPAILVDFYLPAVPNADKRYVCALPEPNRMAKWLKMYFCASVNYWLDPELVFDAYREFLTQPDVLPLNESRIAPHTLTGDDMLTCILKAVDGSHDHKLPGGRLVQGLEIRDVPLTLRSTEARRNRKQLKNYKVHGLIDPSKSLFAQKMLEDPLFMAPKKPKDSLAGVCNRRQEYNTEENAFPGTSIRKAADVIHPPFSTAITPDKATRHIAARKVHDKHFPIRQKEREYRAAATKSTDDFAAAKHAHALIGKTSKQPSQYQPGITLVEQPKKWSLDKELDFVEKGASGEGGSETAA